MASKRGASRRGRRVRPTTSSGLVEPRAEQMDHALPDRVVVAERALQRHGLADERVHVDRNLIGRPADLGDLAARLHQLQRRFERAARARRVADEIGAERTRLRTTSSSVPAGGRRCAWRRAARAASSRGPSFVRPDDDQRVRAGERRHPRAEQPDRAGTEDDDGVARPDRRVHAHRLVGHRVRLGEAGDARTAASRGWRGGSAPAS